MGAGRFIASRMSDGNGRLSKASNTIAWVSVCLSIAIMIVAIAVVDGFKSEIRSRIAGIMGSVMLVQPGQSPINEHYQFTENLPYRRQILEISGVESLSGVAWRSGLIKTENNLEGLYFKGVDSLYDFGFFRDCLVEGEIPDYSGRLSNDILLSRTVSDRLGFAAGDDVLVYFIGDEVKVRKFRLCGIFGAHIEEIDAKLAVVDRRQVQRLNGWAGDEVSSIEIRISPGADIDRIGDSVEDAVINSSDAAAPSLFVTDMRRIYGHLFDWLALLDLNVLMILGLMILVAGFNMISAVLIILFEKIPAIGLLKSLGMNNREVGRVFLIRAGAILARGMLWGNVLGTGLCLLQKYTKLMKLDPASYFVSYVPVSLNPLSILLLNAVAALMILAIVSLSTRFISRVSPDRTMRIE